jgi:glycine cleavage system H protein
MNGVFMQASSTFHIPTDRHYDRASHMWAQLNPSTGNILVGIDTLGLSALGDLAYITLQAVGMPIKRGDSIGSLEAAKMTGDLISPVSGIIIASNEAATHNPLLVNENPYDEGWLVAIEPSDWNSESDDLVSGDDLPAWVEAEIKRYREQGWID